MDVLDDNKEQDEYSRDSNRRNKESFTDNRWSRRENWSKHTHTRTGRILSGIVVVIVGSVLLARQLGVEMPSWLFTWEMLIIVIGIYIGAKHDFCKGGWFVPIIIGSIFLLDDIYPELTVGRMFWPVFIIAAGLFMILAPRKKYRNNWRENCREDWKRKESWKENWKQENDMQEDVIESVSVFGGVKKNIISKDFKGGEITCIFGGAEINLSQADIKGRVVLEVTNVFGGTKLIIPPHWTVKSEMVAILAGIDDKRPVQKDMIYDPDKVLVIHGTSTFGGIDITSY